MTNNERRERDNNPAGETSPTTHTGEGVNTREPRTTRWRALKTPTGPRDWIHEANCYQTHGKYHLTPQNQQHQKHINHAVRLCATCPVIQECNTYIKSLPISHRYGIWAGTQYGDPNQPENRTRQRAKKLL